MGDLQADVADVLEVANVPEVEDAHQVVDAPEVVGIAEVQYEIEIEENDSSESYDIRTEEESLMVSEFFDNSNEDYEEYEDYEDDVFEDDDHSKCVVDRQIKAGCSRDESVSESTEAKEQDLDAPEAALHSSKSSAQSSSMQSSSKNRDYTSGFKKSILESISEQPELAMFPQKKGSKMVKSKITGKLQKDVSRLNSKQHTFPVDKKAVQMEQLSKKLKQFPQLRNWAEMLPALMGHKMLRLDDASDKITAFCGVPITAKDEPHIRTIRNWLKRRKPKLKTEQPPPLLVQPQKKDKEPVPPPSKEKPAKADTVAEGVSKQVKDPLLVQPQKKDEGLVPAPSKKEMAKVDSVANGVLKQLEDPLLVQPQKKDQGLVPPLKKKITAKVDSVSAASKQQQQPLILPPKKNPKFISPIVAEEETLQVKSVEDIVKKFEKLSLAPSQDKASPVLTEETTADVELADGTETCKALQEVPVNQNEDSQESSPQIGEPSQQMNEVEKPEPIEVMPMVIQTLTNEETAPVVILSEEAEKITSGFPCTDDTSTPSIQDDEKVAQEMQCLKVSEGSEKAPPVSPQTKFSGSDSSTLPKCKTAQADVDDAQLGEVEGQIGRQEEARLTEQNEVDSNSGKQAPPVPQKIKFPKPATPLLLEENQAKIDSVVEALKQVGYAPSSLPRAENVLTVPLVSIRENAEQDTIRVKLNQSEQITDFPPVPFLKKDLPHHNNYIRSWPRKKVKKVEELVQKSEKKTKKLPAIVLKALQVPTLKKAEPVEPVSEPPEESTKAPSTSSAPENSVQSSTDVPENTTHTSTIPSTCTLEGTEQPQLAPEQPQSTREQQENITPDSISPQAEIDWQDFQISGDEFEENPITGLPEADTSPESDESELGSSKQDDIDELPVMLDFSTKPIASVGPASSQPSESRPFVNTTHSEYLQKLTKGTIRVFRAFVDHIPKEGHIRDLIGHQVYQWAPCAEKLCDQFCHRCKFCCHQFYCTCQPTKYRALTWCVHMHASCHPDEDDKESVVFFMNSSQMSQPQLAHIRATCYDLDNSITVLEDSFLVKEFGPLRAKVTLGNVTQRCSDCGPSSSCSTCDICIHVYKCVCGAFRRDHLCEHCHVVALYRKRLPDLLKSRASMHPSSSSGISESASNSGGTSTQASGSVAMASDSTKKSGSKK